MIKQEWSYLAQKKMFLLVVIAIITIPTIYTTLFLGSMWDPYGKMDQLPVAVVNKDQPVTYEKQPLTIGDDLVTKLKENSPLAFNFVNQEVADRGLENGTYYMVITIPENFSHNASTLMDSKPQKMELYYDTNPGSNYIASKMSETALLRIRTSVANQVTKTYAEAVFDQIEKVGKGMDKAAKGATKITTGTGKLSDGNNTITSNLKVLSDSTLTFTEGSKSLGQGVAKLEEGSNQLKTGTAAADQGASDLKVGLTTLQQNVKPLGAALPSLATGTSSLKGGIDQLNTGSNTVLSGAKQLNAGLETLDDKSAGLTSGAKSVSDGLTQLLSSLEGNTTKTPSTSALKQTAKEGTLTAANAGPVSGTSADNLQARLDAAKSSGDVDQMAAITQEAISAGKANEASLEEANDHVKTLSSQLKKNSTALSEAADTISNTPTKAAISPDLIQTLQKLQQASASVSSGVSEYTSGVHQLSAGSPALVSGIESINGGTKQLSTGASELQSGTKKLSDSAPDLIQGVNTLQGGAVKLHQGTSALKTGSSDLHSGTVQAKDGADQLSAGADKINTGANLLYSGSYELGSGIKQLKDGSYTLSDQLAKGANQVNNTSTSDETADMFAYPVSSQETKTTTVENNGHAMAPYMMSVALWVACMAFCLMYSVMKYTGELKSGLRWWGSKASILYLIAVVQAPIMVGALHLFNGFSPEHMGKTVLMAILASVTFMSILYFFNAWLGKVGSFIMLIFMVVQLAGSAGTYPVELSGDFVAGLHKWLPFTYTVDAFRSTVSGGQSILPDIIVLSALFLIFTGLTIIIFKFRARRIKAGKRVMNQLLEEKGLM